MYSVEFPFFPLHFCFIKSKQKDVIMKKVNVLIAVLGFLLTTIMANAAESKFEIKGQIIEEQSGETIPYATISLYNETDSSLVTGTVTNDSGEFILEKLKYGKYYLKLSFIGYKDYFIHDLSFGENAKIIDLGQLKMHPASELLGEVEIKSRVSPILNSIDKQVLNVDKNLSATGGTAVDALLLSPSVQVDPDGNIKLRGSTNFTVLINGKPTTLKPDEVLRQTPANLISRIEVITNPSAKYTSSGGAGIINIILKKGAQSGLNGMVNATVGTKDKYSGDLSINLNREKIALSFAVDWRDWNTTALNDYYRDYYKIDTVHHAIMRQDRLINESNLGFRFGLDYNPDETSNIAYSFHGGYTSIEGDIYTKNSGYSQPSLKSKYSYNTFYILQKPKFYTNNLAYNMKLKKEGSSISLNAYYSYIDYYLLTSLSQSMADSNFNIIDTAPYLQDIINDNFSHDYRLNADYTLPVSKKTTLETGGAVHFYKRFLDITYAQFNHDDNQWINNQDYTNKYNFNEDVYSAYVNINTSFWGIQGSVGVRTEFMDRLLKQDSATVGYDYSKLHFFPSFSFSKTLNDKNRINLAMSNRINRPDEYMMNPFPEFEDDYFYSEGNPFLLPEIVRNIELGYQFTGEKNQISSSLYYRTTTDKIEQSLWIEEDEKIHTSFHNDCNDLAIGLEMMGNFDMTSWWSLNANTNLFHYKIEGNVFEDSFSNSDFSWTAQLVNSFQIKENTSIQLIGYYASETIRSQGTLSDYYFVDLAVKQKFLNGRLSLNVQCKDIFQTLNYELKTGTGNMKLLGDFNNESPTLLFSLSWQISNYKKKTKDVNTEFDM